MGLIFKGNQMMVDDKHEIFFKATLQSEVNTRHTKEWLP